MRWLLRRLGCVELQTSAPFGFRRKKPKLGGALYDAFYDVATRMPGTIRPGSTDMANGNAAHRDV